MRTAARRGVVVRGGRAESVVLPDAPRQLVPGRDPRYVERGASVRLSWRGTAARYHVEVSDLAGEEVFLAREVSAPEVNIPAAWPGTFRWRVSAIDDDGLEGPPSEPGFFCVMDE